MSLLFYFLSPIQLEKGVMDPARAKWPHSGMLKIFIWVLHLQIFIWVLHQVSFCHMSFALFPVSIYWLHLKQVSRFVCFIVKTLGPSTSTLPTCLVPFWFGNIFLYIGIVYRKENLNCINTSRLFLTVTAPCQASAYRDRNSEQLATSSVLFSFFQRGRQNTEGLDGSDAEKGSVSHVNQHCSPAGLLPPLPEQRARAELTLHRAAQTVRENVPKSGICTWKAVSQEGMGK